MKNRTAGLAVALLTATLAALPASAQAPPPDADWRTFRTEHFRVTFPAGLTSVARHAADVAERTHAVLSRELAEPPGGPIDMVVTDHTDFSNGFARPFPSNRVVVFVRPALAQFYARDWLELVVAHELVHVFHFEQSPVVGDVVRTVFGRIPLFWPVFPVIATPAWSTEGLATYYESRLTGAGRTHSSLHDMVVRTAALEDAIPELDAVSVPSPRWPAGNRSYIYGARLMAWTADEHGPEVHRSLIDATTGSLWPTFLRFRHVARDPVGLSFDGLYEQWRLAVTDSAEAVAGRVRAAGVTETRPVAGRGPYAVAPRASGDGRRLAFGASDWRSDPTTRVVELESGASTALAERNQFGAILGPASWLPGDSAVVVAQLEFRDTYRLYSDLWRVGLDGRETRLTHGARLAHPDVAPDGRRVAAVQSHRAGIRLVVHDLDTGGTRVVAAAGPGQAYDRPRWSPDGRRIAVGRNVDGRTDLVVVDAATGAVTAVTDDSPLDLAPAWSPDGRWLLWWSDRTGVPNIMAVAIEDGRPAGPVRQVTNVVTGVIDPEVSPDGETLYLATYHDDGWHIEALAFDPAAWSEAPPPDDRYGPAMLSHPDAGDTRDTRHRRDDAAAAGSPDAPPPADAPVPAEPYSPWPTVRPYAWLPRWQPTAHQGDTLHFVGASVSGHDVVGRHDWSFGMAAEPDSRRLSADGHWIYRGLGNPTLFLMGRRSWSSVRVAVGNVVLPTLLREDAVTAGAVVHRRRWRSNAGLQIAGEVERELIEAPDTAAVPSDVFPVTRTLAGVSISPSFATAAPYPLSISLEDGVRTRVGVGRWWDLTSGAPAYDEVTGRLAWYRGVPVWGFADHVLAARVAGLLRVGDRAPVQSVGGVGSGLPVVGDGASSFPVRGFTAGVRYGTRAWTANAEWRFPIRLRDSPGSVLGFSLVAASGALFLDAGTAWCTDPDRRRYASCATRAGARPLVSTGAELQLDLGILHNTRARLSMGVAQPLQGPGQKPVFYVGTAF